MPGEKIKNSRKLEFAALSIESVAEKLGVEAERMCQVFTEKSEYYGVTEPPVRRGPEESLNES